MYTKLNTLMIFYACPDVGPIEVGDSCYLEDWSFNKTWRSSFDPCLVTAAFNYFVTQNSSENEYRKMPKTYSRTLILLSQLSDLVVVFWPDLEYHRCPIPCLHKHLCSHLFYWIGGIRQVTIAFGWFCIRRCTSLWFLFLWSTKCCRECRILKKNQASEVHEISVILNLFYHC